MNLGYSKEELAKQEESERTFISSMAHELRSPIHIIRGLAEVASTISNNNKVSLEEVRNATKGIQATADRLQRIVNDVLDYSKLSTGMVG